MSTPLHVVPGHPALHLPIPAGSDRKRVLIHDGETPRDAGTVTEVLELVSGPGGEALRREQTLRFPPVGELVGISHAAAATLSPLAHETRRADVTVRATYEEQTIVGETRRADGERQPFARRRLPGMFDLYTFELLLRALPLAPGFACDLTLFWPERHAAVAATATVVGAEPMATGKGAAEPAWIVAATIAELGTRYWVGERSRELLRQTQQLADGTRIDFVR